MQFQFCFSLFYSHKWIEAISETVFTQELSPSGTCDPLCSVDETSSEDFEASYQAKTDSLKALAILAAAGTGALAINHSWVAANQVCFQLSKSDSQFIIWLMN